MSSNHDKEKEERIIEELNERKEDLVKEIEEYNREREQIKAMLGQLGGEKYKKTDKVLNIIFIAAIVVFFALEFTTDFFPTFVSLEIGILLISVKIVWMIHSQHKFNHFEFWILNSIEFRMNHLYTRVKRMEKQLNSVVPETRKEEEETAGASSRQSSGNSDRE
jgi:hypothetical protein